MFAITSTLSLFQLLSGERARALVARAARKRGHSLSIAAIALSACVAGHVEGGSRKVELTPIRSARVAVVVGVSQYTTGTGFRALDYAHRDAERLRDVLKQHDYDVHLLIDGEAMRKSILETIAKASAGVAADGTLLFFFAGHGFEQEKVNYLATFSTYLSDLRGSGLSLDAVREELRKGGAKRRVVFIDACRNDPAGGRSVSAPSFIEPDHSEGEIILMSTRRGDLSYEDDGLGHGVFTYFLAQGLEGAAANQGSITVLGLADYMAKQMHRVGIDNKRDQMPFLNATEASGAFVLGDAVQPPIVKFVPTPTPFRQPVRTTNRAPTIGKVTPMQAEIRPGRLLQIEVVASDPDGDSLEYECKSTRGTCLGSGPTFTFHSQDVGNMGDAQLQVSLRVGDGRDWSSPRIVQVLVKASPEVGGPEPTIIGVRIKLKDAFVLSFEPPYSELVVDTDNEIDTGKSMTDPDPNLYLKIGTGTVMLDRKNKEISPRQIRGGFVLEIDVERFAPCSAGSRPETCGLIVRGIKVKDDHEPNNIELVGYYESLNAPFARIAGRRMLMAKGAEIHGKDQWKDRKFGSFDAMMLGSRVKVRGTTNPDGWVDVKAGDTWSTVTSAELGNRYDRLDQFADALLSRSIVELQIGKRKVQLSRSKELAAHVTRVGLDLVPDYIKNKDPDHPTRLRFEFFVIDDEDLNAFALPNGTIFIYTGMLRLLQNDSELAAVLGREIAHTTHEHGRDRLSGRKGGFAINLPWSRDDDDKSAGTTAAPEFDVWSETYDDNDERQADRVSLYYMSVAGYDSAAAPEVWKRIALRLGPDAAVESGVSWSDRSNAIQRIRSLNREHALNHFHDPAGRPRIETRQAVAAYQANVIAHLGAAKPRSESTEKADDSKKPEWTQVFVRSSWANVRANPSTDTEVVDRLPCGAQLSSDRRESAWLHVKLAHGGDGWVHDSTVTTDSPKCSP